ncbi:uncharacterized protein LOC133908474 [Phragmites australis]|uniref:uncharacterized protein LOC133908474 n=1 Tax=Phragmites australis TaxID=29695 RepID=UPI002D769DC2|nr:uncharacterized protein LOC133908474 [Phragmites australis]
MLPTKMAPHSSAACHLCVLFLLLSTATLSSAASTSDSSLCAIPSPAPMNIAAGKEETLRLLRSFQLNAGYFFGGEDIHFSKDESDDFSYVARSFSLVPHRVDRTNNSALLHVAATLTLSGGRARHLLGAHRRSHRYVGGHSVSFNLDGYYSNTTGELCMDGSGTYSEEDGSLEHLPDVVLHLRVPNPSSLSDPFVTGRVKGAGFEAISLVAFAEDDSYEYGKSASCWPSEPSSPARGAVQALGAKFSCAHLKEQLVSSYKLRYGGGAHASSASPLLRLQEQRMHVSQVQCTAGGAARAYVVFSNNTKMRGDLQLRPRFMVKEEAVVAEGRWDSTRGMLCLRACRLVHLGPTSLAVQPQECDIGMSFWFPGVWTIRDRSVVAGMLWNSSQAAGSKNAISAISASSIDVNNHRSNFSDVKYNYDYTIVEKAKNHYHNLKKKVKGSFPAANYTYQDFEFSFFTSLGHGDAYPVTIGPVMVYGDRLAADDSFSRHAVVNMDRELLDVSYDIRNYVHHAGWVRPKNESYPISFELRQITAEGVYDPKTGILCMIGCQELNGSTDCKILITVQFASIDAHAQDRGRGVISSLRDRTDPLFFEKMDIMFFGMYSEQMSEAISRMDLESIMLVISTTLPCVFTVLQILHTKRNPEASAATSITMLVVLALGYVYPLVLSSEALFVSRRRHYVPFWSYVPYELSQMMLRAPTLISFVLQLRLLQLAWSGRNSVADQSKAETSSAAERRALWICLPLYLFGGALTIIFHVINNRAAREDSLAVRIGPEPATLWEDLVSSAGLALDGFLLPQVVMNVFSGAGVRAISPWFYVGCTVVRAMPHIYDVIRIQGYMPSMKPSYVYAGPRDDRFGVAWDITVPCVTALLAVLLFLQQRRGGRGALLLRSRRPGGYEMVSTI